MNQHQPVLQAIKVAAQAVDASAEVLLFGSRARGDEKEDSNWDVLILVDKPEIDMKYESKFLSSFLEIELIHSIAINSLIINKQKWNTKYQGYPIKIEIEKDKVLL